MVLFGEFRRKKSKTVPKTKLMPKTAKTILVPYIFPYFFKKFFFTLTFFLLVSTWNQSVVTVFTVVTVMAVVTIVVFLVTFGTVLKV